MFKWLPEKGKYLIAFVPFLVFIVSAQLTAYSPTLMYTFYLTNILIVVLFDLWSNIKKNKRTGDLVNVAEEIAKGNLRIEIGLGKGTRRNLDKIQENLKQLIKIYCDYGYDLEAIREKQKKMLSRYKEIALFFITDETGQQIYNSLEQNLVNNSDRSYFILAKQTGKPQISDIVISKVTNKLAIVLAVPYFRGSEFAGIFSTTIDMQAVSTSEEKLGK
mgnify:CR=1 FL=1